MMTMRKEKRNLDVDMPGVDDADMDMDADMDVEMFNAQAPSKKKITEEGEHCII